MEQDEEFALSLQADQEKVSVGLLLLQCRTE